jgi:hypothetical protein
MGREQAIAQPSLYDTDFYSWTAEQAKLLRAGDLRAIDVANIAEEIETLGRSEAAALRSSLRLIVTHLLKAIHQPHRASRSWLATIRRERINVERSLKDNPGLKSKLSVLFIEAYEDGREEAINETGLAHLPDEPELTLDQVRDKAFVPPSLAGCDRD